jgi:hypothetical protein
MHLIFHDKMMERQEDIVGEFILTTLLLITLSAIWSEP